MAACMLRRSARQVAYQSTRLASMPKQDTRSSVARKVNFTIQVLREAVELLEVAETRLPHSASATRDAFRSAMSSTPRAGSFDCRHSRCYQGGRQAIPHR